MRAHSEQDREEVKAMLEEGMSVAEIVKAIGIPRATVYRWKQEFEEPKQDIPPPTIDTSKLLEQIEAQAARIAALEGQMDKLMEQLIPAFKWIDQKVREEEKAREIQEYERSEDPKPGLVLKLNKQ